MKKLRFRTRLIIAFSSILAFMLVLGLFALYELNTIDKHLQRMYNQPLVVSNAVRDIEANTELISHKLDHFIMAEDSLEAAVHLKTINTSDKLINNSFKIISNKFLGETSSIDSLHNAYKNYSVLVDDIIKLKKKEDIVGAYSLYQKRGKIKVDDIYEKARVLTDFAQNKADEIYQNSIEETKQNIVLFCVVMAIFILASISIAITVSKSISKPIWHFIKELKLLYKKEETVQSVLLNENEERLLVSSIEELKTAYFKLNTFNSQLSEKVKERTHELHKSKDFLHNIINNLADPVFVKDEKSRLIIVNNAFCNIFGVSQEEVLGKTFTEGLSKDEFNRINNIDEKVLENGEEHIKQDSLTTSQGDSRTVLTKIIRYVDESDKPFLVGVLTDITELRNQRVQLKKAKEKAEHSEKLKTAFLANMSHEIRTPMNAILGFTSLLDDDVVDESKKKKFIELIQEAGKRLLAIISDVVDISKIEAKQLSINLDTCNLNEIIDSLYFQFSIQNKTKDVSIEIHKSLDDNDCFVKTDRNRLVQILSNLIENALKFTKQGSVTFGYSIDKDKIKFYVKDTGIGISEKDKKIIFNRFSQVDNEYTKAVTGTGLGLSIAKGLVELLGGNIWVENTLTEGSTFIFTVPFVSDNQKETYVSIVKEDMIKNNTEEKTILVAEDELTNFIYIREVLKVFNIKIIRAENGQEAVDLFKENKDINLILMDIKMPILNGYEATLEIRKTSTTVPIIAITAYAMAEDEALAMKAGCNEYISKPVSKGLLYNVIKKYLHLDF
ncbi:ATP-binding protein [Yeosuana marina]|uniref:ATP-binding protein n=1 Tax=Yeosuana marina TaxID=1565536 RepID=UPI0030C8BB0A